MLREEIRVLLLCGVARSTAHAVHPEVSATQGQGGAPQLPDLLPVHLGCSAVALAVGITGCAAVLVEKGRLHTLSWNQLQLESSSVDLMKLRWTPRERWTPQQSMYKKTPYVMLAQLGFLAPQWKQALLVGIAQSLL